MNYDEHFTNQQFNCLYWGIAIGTLLMVCLELGKRVPICRIKTKRNLETVKRVGNYFKHKWYVYVCTVFGIGLVYAFLAGNIIDYSEVEGRYAAQVYFWGSSRLDSRMILWIFLELVITTLAVNLVYQYKKYNYYRKLIAFKSKRKYVRFLNAVIITSVIFSVIVVYIGVAIRVKANELIMKSESLLRYDSRINGLVVVNMALCFYIFVLLVWIIQLYIKDIIRSYCIVMGFQLINFLAGNLNSSIIDFLPLVQGCGGMCSPDYTCEYGLKYQLVEIIFIVLIGTRIYKKQKELL